MVTQKKVSKYVESLTYDQIYNEGVIPLICKKFDITVSQARRFFDYWVLNTPK